MERNLSTLKLFKKLMIKKIFLFLTFLATALFAFAQTPSVIQNIRIPLWAEVDAYPELAAAQNPDTEAYSYPVNKIRELAPFLINGMVYGWNFVYTPSDKARQIEEVLEITPIMDVEAVTGAITYVSPWLENERLNCWCEFKRSEAQVQNYYLWSSIQNPKIHGRGKGELSDGFDGIKNAAEDALKDAVRSHYRKVIKNKPKKITGAVLIRDMPTIGVADGKYVINLDFFLECGKIIEYKVY